MSQFFKHRMRRKSPGEIAGWILLGIIAFTGFALLFGFAIMWLWNWLMPAVFGLPTVNYWQAVGIFIIFKLLFGGCGGGSRFRRGGRSRARCGENDRDFSKWKYYDEYWKEEGDEAYKAYISRRTYPTGGDDPERYKRNNE